MTILLLLVILVMIIIMLPIKVSVDYYRQNQKDQLKIAIKFLFGLIHYRLELSNIKIQRKLFLPFIELHAELFGRKSKIEDLDLVLGQFNIWSINLPKVIHELKLMLRVIDQYESLFELLKGYFQDNQESLKGEIKKVFIYRLLRMIFRGLPIKCQKFSWQTKFGFADASVTGIANGLIWIAKTIVLSFLGKITHLKTTPEISVVPCFQSAGVEIELKSIFSLRIVNIISMGFKILLKSYKRRAKNRWLNIQLKD